MEHVCSRASPATASTALAGAEAQSVVNLTLLHLHSLLGRKKEMGEGGREEGRH